MNLVQPIRFAAQWTEQNAHLREKALTDYSTNEIIQILFNDPTFWAESLLKGFVQPLVSRVVVMSWNDSPEERIDVQKKWESRWADGGELRQFYDPIPLELTTPDHVAIRGVFYRNRFAGGVNIPTLVMHMPNAGLHKNGAENLFLDKQQYGPFHIVCYDYRGTGESRGVPLSARQLALDGDTIHQCVRSLGVSEENIRHFGKSLGGAVSAWVRAMHPSHAPYASCHSFSSITDLVEETDHADDLVRQGTPVIEQLLPAWLADLLLQIFSADVIRSIFAWIFRLCEWEFNALPALEAIGQDALVINDPQDELVKERGASIAEGVQRLQISPIYPFPPNPYMLGHHNLALEEAQDAQGTQADFRIVQFLTQQIPL